MKFIFVGDPHFSDVGVSSRLDDYMETSLDKLRFLVDLAQKLKAHLVFAGDTFQQNLYNAYYRSQIRHLMSQAFCITVIGNHNGDTIRSNYSTWKEREVGDFIASGVLMHIDSFREANPNFLGLNAYQYKPEDLPGKILKADSVQYIFAHSFIDVSSDELSFSSQALKRAFPNLKTIFAGHDHQRYEPITYGGVTILRPGSMMRTSSKEDSKRIPSVYFYDTDTDQYEEISIACAKPYDMVFKVEAKIVAADAERQVDTFISSVSGMKSEESSVSKVVLDMVSQLEDSELKKDIKADLSKVGFGG